MSDPTQEKDRQQAQRARTIRLALMFAALAFTFYAGSFFFLTD
tara:strand:- start:9 stop:137 length:129 start_codon:yes stop_codon:yes gene_type:complete